MIKSYDGQTVRSAMIDAIVAQEMERRTDERVADERVAELELRKSHDGRIYTRLIERARQDYPEPPRSTRPGAIGWALVGYIVLAFAALHEGIGL